jgi:hypothetical protein
MAILMQRGEAGRRQRVACTIDNGPDSYPRQAGLVSHLDNPRGFHIHRTRPAPSPQGGFSRGIGHDLPGRDKYALLYRQLRAISRRLDLVNEVAIGRHDFPGGIVTHKRCADDQGPSGKLWAETPSKSKAHQGVWGEVANEQAGTLGSACAPHPSLHGYMLSCIWAEAVQGDGRRPRALPMAETDKSCRDLPRQGDDQANATQPITLPLTAER